MVIVGKVLRKGDKEELVRDIVLANGFQKQIAEIDNKIQESVRNWEKSRAIELFECSEKGALALLANRKYLDQTMCVLFVEGDGAGSWKETRFRASTVLSCFPASCKTMMPISEELGTLIEKKEALKLAERNAKKELAALLLNINSSKMLLEQFPDFAKFVQIENSGAKALVSVATIEAVSSLLNAGGEK